MSLGRSLDSSLDNLEEIRFKMHNKKLMQDMAKKLHFTYTEIECLMIIYYKLQKQGSEKSGGVTRSQLRDILHMGLDMTAYTLLDYIVSTLDRGLSKYVSKECWLKMMSLFLRGSLEEKIKYCYNVYSSLSITEKLLRNTMITLLKHSLIKDNNEDDEEGVKDMVDMIIKKMDYDRDTKVSFNDFRTSVLKSPLLLQAFGQVLPDRLAVHAFMLNFTSNVGKV